MCNHPGVDVDVAVDAFEDTNVRIVKVTARCLSCGVRMMFLGMPIGFSFARPTTCVEGVEAIFPMVPEGVIADREMEAMLGGGMAS